MKDFKVYLVLASLLMIGYIVAEYNKPSQVNWQPVRVVVVPPPQLAGTVRSTMGRRSGLVDTGLHGRSP